MSTTALTTSVAGNILHVITTISRGGAENHLVELITCQISAGSRVVVAYLKGDGYWRSTLESRGARVIDLCMGFYGHPGPVVKLRGLLRDFGPNLVHAHMPPAELYCRLALLGVPPGRLPMVTTKHNDERFYDGIGQRTVGRWVSSRSEKIIAISDAVRQYMIGNRGLGLDADKIVTIHYGLNADPFEQVEKTRVAELRHTWGVGDDEFLIGTVARLVPQKALHVLLEGFALYRQNATRPSRLALVGSGPLEQELRQQAVRLGINDGIVWAGFREDIPVVMNALDVFALTSIYEGFGLVLLEAMAAGRAVVASSVSAISEIVVDGETGILISPCSHESLAEAFGRLAADVTRHKMGEAGRARVRSTFTTERMVAETGRVYAACLKERWNR